MLYEKSKFMILVLVHYCTHINRLVNHVTTKFDKGGDGIYYCYNSN